MSLTINLSIKNSYRLKNTYGKLENLLLSLKVLAVFLLSAFLLCILIKCLHIGNHYSTLGALKSYVLGEAGVDSWTPMILAVKQTRNFPNDSIYKNLILKDNTKFQYPPSSLIFIDIPQKLTGGYWQDVIDYANKLAWFCLPAIVFIFFYLLITEALTPFIIDRTIQINLTYQTFLSACLLSVATVYLFYPVLQSYRLGQIQTFMTTLAGLSLIAWRLEKFALAGFLLGICVGIKPQWLAILPWALLRHQWKFLNSFLATSLILMIFSIFLYGAQQWLDYISVLSFISKHGECFYPNQSVNGLLNRMFQNGSNLAFTTNAFPPFNVWIYTLTVISSILILGSATLWKRNNNPGTLELAIIMLSLTMASPIAWEHHYGIIVLIYALVLPNALHTRPFGQWTIPYLWLAFILTSQQLEAFTSSLAYTHWNFVQSYLFFGATMLLFLIYKLSFNNAESHKSI